VNKLVVQLPMSEDTDFDQLIHVEEALLKALLKGRLAVVDGHDMGEDRFNIFIRLEENWIPVIARVSEALDALGVLPEVLIAKVRGSSGRYEVVHPADYSGTFTL
jgi:hypothetical protein